MGKKYGFIDWICITLITIVMLGLILGILAILIYQAASYKYGVYIVVYIAICGIIGYWLLKRKMEGSN